MQRILFKKDVSRSELGVFRNLRILYLQQKSRKTENEVVVIKVKVNLKFNDFIYKKNDDKAENTILLGLKALRPRRIKVHYHAYLLYSLYFP